MLGRFRVFAVALSGAAITACVSDPNVENYVPASAGAHQPAGDGVATLSASDACKQLKDAEATARAKLACTASTSPKCPAYLAVAGALPCGLYDESTVTACVAEIGQYGACSDFDTKRCVVTPVFSSCHAALRPEGGTDAAVPETPDATTGNVNGGSDASDAGAPDAVAADAGAGPG